MYILKSPYFWTVLRAYFADRNRSKANGVAKPTRSTPKATRAIGNKFIISLNPAETVRANNSIFKR